MKSDIFVNMSDDFLLEEEEAAELVKENEEEEKKEEEEEEKKDEEEEELEGNVLEEEALVSHLSILDSPNDLEYAYTKLLMNESEIKDASILSNYTHLRFISLAGNALRRVPWLAEMTEAVYMDLHGNSIKFLPEFEKTIPDLINFNLQGNKIRNIPVLRFPLLTKLDLSENMVKMIAPAAFAEITQLAELKLSQNRIRRINSDTFKGLHNLKVLSLDNNEIKSIADDAWQDLTSLTTLDISENQIKSLKSFQGSFPALMTLVMGANQVEKLDELNVFKEYENLRELTTTGNPLNQEEEYRLCIIEALPQLTKVDDEEEITQEDRESAAEFVAQKKAEEEEQRRLEEEARRAEEEEEEAERRRRLAEEEEEQQEEKQEEDENEGDDDEEEEL